MAVRYRVGEGKGVRLWSRISSSTHSEFLGLKTSLVCTVKLTRRMSPAAYHSTGLDYRWRLRFSAAKRDRLSLVSQNSDEFLVDRNIVFQFLPPD